MIGINLVPKMSADPYTYVFETFKDEMGESRYIVLRLTTNKKDRAEQITKYLNKSKMTI